MRIGHPNCESDGSRPITPVLATRGSDSANGLKTSTIRAGEKYLIPDSDFAYGDSGALGQATLNRDNARLERLALEKAERLKAGVIFGQQKYKADQELAVWGHARAESMRTALTLEEAGFDPSKMTYDQKRAMNRVLEFEARYNEGRPGTHLDENGRPAGEWKPGDRLADRMRFWDQFQSNQEAAARKAEDEKRGPGIVERAQMAVEQQWKTADTAGKVALAAQGVGMGSSVVPVAGDWVSAGSSAVVWIAQPSWEHAGDLGLDLIGALPGVPALGTLRRMGRLAEMADTIRDTGKLAEGTRTLEKTADIASATNHAEDVVSTGNHAGDVVGTAQLPAVAAPNKKPDLSDGAMKKAVNDTDAPKGEPPGSSQRRTSDAEADVGDAKGAAKLKRFKFDNVDDFNRAANNAVPNASYEFNGYTWVTDERGRVKSAGGVVKVNAANARAGTDGVSTVIIGKDAVAGARTGDVGFHLIGDGFDAPTNRLNVVAGNGKRVVGNTNPNLNQGAYKAWENSVRDLARDPKNRVEMLVEPAYYKGNLTPRPDAFVAQYRVNGGEWQFEEFLNQPGG